MYQVHLRYPNLSSILFNIFEYNQIHFASIYLIVTLRCLSSSQEILDSKREFVRFIAHELRNPLNTVYLGLNLLKKSLKEILAPEDIMRTLRDVQSSCDASLTILNDMLSYEKLDAGILTLDRTIFSPMALLESSTRPFLLQVREYVV